MFYILKHNVHYIDIKQFVCIKSTNLSMHWFICKIYHCMHGLIESSLYFILYPLSLSLPLSLPSCIFFVAFSVTQSDDLITYLKTVIESYTKSRKPLKFFEDLMSLAAQPSPDFEEKLLSLINTLFSTSHLQKQLKEQLESFFVSQFTSFINWTLFPQNYNSLQFHLPVILLIG